MTEYYNGNGRFVFPSESTNNTNIVYQNDETVVVNTERKETTQIQASEMINFEPTIFSPIVYSDAANIVDGLESLIKGENIVIDLSSMIYEGKLKEEGTRLVDYVCGASKALHCIVKKGTSATLSIYKL